MNWNKITRIGILASLALVGCSKYETRAESSKPKFLGPDGEKALLIMGQDYGSLREYTQSNCCDVPGGVTTYVGLFKIFSEGHKFGGMGIDAQGNPLDYFADWGGGISSLYTTMQEYPNSALAIGLSMTENEHPGGLQDLLNGKYDREIVHLTKLLKQHTYPVYLRIGYEFDGMWNAGYGDRKQYRDAYRYVVDIIRQQGETNIDFVWQSSTSPADDSIEGGHEDIRDWYPGDEYVDWMGLSWFIVPDYVGNKSTVDITQNALADELVEFARERNKPVMIAEATPLAYDLTQNYKANHSPVWDGKPHENKVEKEAEQIWQEWFVPFFDYIYKNKDVIKAVAYINANWDQQPMWSGDYESGYWGDSRVQNNPVILEKWNKEISKAYWLTSGDNLKAELRLEE